MIIINPIGGLANRMRALASGVALAKITNQDFRIIWHQDRTLNARFDRLFEIPDSLKGKIIYPGKLTYKLLYSAPKRTNLFISALSYVRFSENYLDEDGRIYSLFKVGNYNKTMFEVAFRHRDKKLYIQSGSTFYDFSRPHLLSLFKPLATIQENIDARLHELGDDRIGIHIRRTDHVQAIKHSPDELFYSQINHLGAKRERAIFYLATDDEPTKQRFAAKYGNRLIFNERKADRNSEAGIRDAVTELFVLAGCRNVIGSSYSSFPQLAAFLGGIPLTRLSL